MKAARRAHRLAHLARLHLGDQIENELRQLGAFAPPQLSAVERRLAIRIGDGELPEVLALGGARRQILRLAGDLLELLRSGGRGQGQQNVRHVELVIGRGGLLALEILLELVRRHVDVGDDVALSQGGQRQLLAHGLAVLLVIDPLGREGGRQLIERDLIALGDLLKRAVQLFVRDGQADPLGALRLDLLQDQAVEHLLAQHALGGQLDLLFLKPLRDRIHLRVELALQDQAVVHDGRNAVQQFAVHADVPGLRMSRRHEGDRRKGEAAKGR